MLFQSALNEIAVDANVVDAHLGLVHVAGCVKVLFAQTGLMAFVLRGSIRKREPRPVLSLFLRKVKIQISQRI
jgi:hypothetical protein